MSQVPQSDPIASATLARLYLKQGHTTRALAILDEVLGRAPFDGDALALRGRLVPGRPRLSATVKDGVLSVRWQGLRAPERYALVVCLWGGDAVVPRPWVTSRPCTGAFGQHRFSFPWSTGVLIASIGRVEKAGFAPQVVAEPLGWG